MRKQGTKLYPESHKGCYYEMFLNFLGKPAISYPTVSAVSFKVDFISVPSIQEIFHSSLLKAAKVNKMDIYSLCYKTAHISYSLIL